ncbi:WhiB family transcriptional regulator [Streptomyces sp. NPDC002690]
MDHNPLAGTDWQKRSSCRWEDPELFFPVGDTGPALLQIEEAKSVCRLCPVVDACLRWAMKTDQAYGVWGGTSEADRRQALRESGRLVRTGS